MQRNSYYMFVNRSVKGLQIHQPTGFRVAAMVWEKHIREFCFSVRGRRPQGVRNKRVKIKGIKSVFWKVLKWITGHTV